MTDEELVFLLEFGNAKQRAESFIALLDKENSNKLFICTEPRMRSKKCFG